MKLVELFGRGGNYLEISNCSNFGKIKSNNTGAGGICGTGRIFNIVNSYNNVEGDVVSTADSAGGIVGRQCTARSGSTIYNCYNLGKINGINVGGIIGDVYHNVKCINVFTTGELTGTNVGGIIGSALWNNVSENMFKNCYYIKNSIVTKSTGKTITADATGITDLSNNEIEQLNKYINENPDSLETSSWLNWSIDVNSNPVFEVK